MDKRLWEMGLNSPELQKILADSMKEDTGETPGYKMPLGNIREYIFSDKIKEDARERAVQQIHDIDKLSFKAISTAFAELQVALTLKEVKGEPLTPLEKTLKDIDLTAFVLLGIRRWLALVTHEPATGQPVEGSREE